MEYSKEQAFVDTVQAKSHQLYRIATVSYTHLTLPTICSV